jgi:hypothetical protein
VKGPCRVCRGEREFVDLGSGPVCSSCGAGRRQVAVRPGREQTVVCRCPKCTSLTAVVSDSCLICCGCGSVAGYRRISDE